MTHSEHRPPLITVVSASPRRERLGTTIADWVRAPLPEATQLIDLGAVTLPDDSGLSPGGNPGTELSETLAASDGFVFVTPEYNRSFPGVLKRLIDWHYHEWELKAATIVGYGVTGGYGAVANLRPVLSELNMVATRREIGLPAPWNHTDEEGFHPGEGTEQALKAALEELQWWAGVLADARRNRPFPG